MCNCKNIDELMNEIAFYRIQIDELKEQNKSQGERMVKLYGSNETLRAILKKKDERIEELHEHVEKLEKENKELKTPNFSDTCKDNTIKHLATENATLKSVANTQRDRIKELSDENETIRSAINIMDTIVDVNDMTVDVNAILDILGHMTDTMANTADAFKNAASILTRANEETEDDN